jgi:hypothetical protein
MLVCCTCQLPIEAREFGETGERPGGGAIGKPSRGVVNAASEIDDHP